MAGNERFLTTSEAAEFLARLAGRHLVSARQLRQWRAQGRGPAYLHLAGRVFYSPEALREFLQRRTTVPEAA